MDQILPFGEVPQKMASSVKKTFLSSRAMYKAVQSAFDIADKMKSVSILESVCYKKQQKKEFLTSYWFAE